MSARLSNEEWERQVHWLAQAPVTGSAGRHADELRRDRAAILDELETEAEARREAYRERQAARDELRWAKASERDLLAALEYAVDNAERMYARARAAMLSSTRSPPRPSVPSPTPTDRTQKKRVEMVYRAFTSDSYWNQPAPTGKHPDSDKWIAYLKAHSPYPYPRLQLSPAWAMPIYWPSPADPWVNVDLPGDATVTCRMPKTATPMGGSDGAMVLIDLEANQCFSFWKMVKVDALDWQAEGWARYYLDTNGDCKTVYNIGHRGIPPIIQAWRKDEQQASIVQRKLEIYIPGTAPQAIYPPMCGYEPDRGGIIPEGALIRIKQDNTGRNSLEVALRDYGAVVGDNSPVASIKCERALIGSKLLYADSLKLFPWDKWEFAV